mmetsp:Transcript_13347/g.14767  ORF Transcript_13347/g.14767 Transcript_13347/m.14767 type:complete len:221 (+) Transcript_13347:652-1314(+)
MVDVWTRQQTLAEVLRAYTYDNRHSGYFQGMGYMALILLKEVVDAENTFWMLTAVMKNFGVASLYSDINGMLYFHYICLRKHSPKLSKHLLLQGIRPSMYAQSWYLSAFVRDLPYEHALRVWDVFLLKGKCFLLQVGIALIELKADRLMASTELGELINIISDLDNIPSADELIETARSIHITDSQLMILATSFEEYKKKPYEAYLDDDLKEFSSRKMLD